MFSVPVPPSTAAPPEVWKCIMADDKDDKEVKDEDKPIKTEDLDKVSGGFAPVDGAPKPYNPVDG
jgi:hypothetical protein